MKRILTKALLLLSAGIMAVSCYDDTKLWDEVNNLSDRVLALEDRLNNELQALTDMIKGGISIEKCELSSEGVYTLELSNGVDLSLNVNQLTSLKTVVSYSTLAGEDYWAYYDAKGVKHLIFDENGDPIPVRAETPTVETIDGESYLVIGDMSYPLVGNSVFSNYVVNTDDEGNVLSVTFTFGEDMTFTVTVDGAAGLQFIQAVGFGSTVLNNYYVAYGQTSNVQVLAQGVEDYVIQAPDGWRVTEWTDEFNGDLYFAITAPKAEDVASGSALAEGYMKVFVVLDGGKASVSKLYLTSTPFKEFTVVSGNAVITMYDGLAQYIYGACKASEFDADAVFAVAEGLLDVYDYPAGYNVTSENISAPLADVCGSEPVLGESYVLWALPAIYSETSGGYFLSKDTFVTKTVAYTTVSFEVSNVTFRDATLDFSLEGAASYYGGVCRKDEMSLSDILLFVNNGFYEPKTSPMTYSGSVFSFGDSEVYEVEKATDYIAWVLPIDENTQKYQLSDIVSVEFTTMELEPGSDITIVPGEAVLKANSITVPLGTSHENASMIFYSFVSMSDNGKYPDDESKIEYLINKGTCEVASTVEAVNTGMKPLTEVYLYALAVDENGQYGSVYTQSYKTTETIYNSMKVELDLVENTPEKQVVSISTTGGEPVDYLYWVGTATADTWVNTKYLGGSVATAQEYMANNPTRSFFTAAKQSYPIVDGKIEFTNLTMNTKYVMVIMAKDAEGIYSKAQMLTFTPRPIALGDVVYATDSEWEAARPTINFLTEKFYAGTGMMSGNYDFEITVPTGFTAYVLAGSVNYPYTNGSALKDDMEDIEVEDKIVAIIQAVDKSRDVNFTVDEALWEEKGYPYGHEFYHYVHGCPLYGNVIIWANEEWHVERCGCEFVEKSTKVVNGVTVDVTNVIVYNEGTSIEVRQPQAIGSKTEIIDRIFVVCQDLEGNCCEPFEFDVPFEYFANAGARDE